MRNPLVHSHTFEQTGVTVLRLRQPLRWWRKRAFERYLKARTVIVPISEDPEGRRLFDRMDYWDSWGSLRG